MNFMTKVGDIVDYHNVIGGGITSKAHEVTRVGVTPAGDDAADITGKSGFVALAALSPHIDAAGQTWDDWAEELFETLNCEVCGKGKEGHVPHLINDHWFAYCKDAIPKEDEIIVMSRTGQKGVATGGHHSCTLSGCSGMRIATRWPDGSMTYPCTKGMSYDTEKKTWEIL